MGSLDLPPRRCVRVSDYPAPSKQSSFKTRVLQAGLWSLIGYGLTFAIRLGGNLFMTRHLAPEMFGIMAIASTVLVGLAMFSDLGLKPSVIQNRRGNDS